MLVLLMGGFAASENTQEEQRIKNQLALEARKYTGLKCDFLEGESGFGYIEADLKYAKQHLMDGHHSNWQFLDEKKRRIVNQQRSTDPLSHTMYAKDDDEAYFSRSWYEPKTKLFYENFCFLKMAK